MTVDVERLAQVRATLVADGFDLEVDHGGSRVTVRIVASVEACPDCLVPKPLLRSMLQPILGVDADAIDLTYPSDA
jgi:hypothetical protein